MTALGLRVVDLVVPRSRPPERLADYLQPWALPPSEEALGSDDEMQALSGVYIGTFRTPHGVLRFQVLRRPGGVLPPDLNNPFVRRNGWVEETPDGDYVVLDTDHSAVLTQALELDATRLRGKFEDIHSSVRRVFDAAVTPDRR